MSGNPNVIYDDIDGASRAAFLRSSGLGRPKTDATIVSLERGGRKQPLGLRPAEGPDDNDNHREDYADDPTMGWPGFHFGKDKDQAFLESAVRFDWLFHFLDIVGGALLGVHNDGVREINSLWDDVKRKFREAEAAQRTELADLRATVAELRGELREMKAIQESARIEARGERGLDGPRGIAGPQGPAGPRGKTGERGAPAAMIAAYEADPTRYMITPRHTDGTSGVPMHLRSLFEHFNAEITPDDED
jgi:hypothetical protein